MSQEYAIKAAIDLLEDNGYRVTLLRITPATETKYRLLKDLPDGSRIGDIYEWHEHEGEDETIVVYINTTQDGKTCWDAHIVKNKSEWFKEVYP